ncbi:hypothetical protein BC826DRAFT_684028 [Russula brevipes]|nr:hypothetical protein BC826DRAFT_684028 [Russula brevipes]
MIVFVVLGRNRGSAQRPMTKLITSNDKCSTVNAPSIPHCPPNYATQNLSLSVLRVCNASPRSRNAQTIILLQPLSMPSLSHVSLSLRGTRGVNRCYPRLSLFCPAEFHHRAICPPCTCDEYPTCKIVIFYYLNKRTSFRSSDDVAIDTGLRYISSGAYSIWFWNLRRRDSCPITSFFIANTTCLGYCSRPPTACVSQCTYTAGGLARHIGKWCDAQPRNQCLPTPGCSNEWLGSRPELDHAGLRQCGRRRGAAARAGRCSIHLSLHRTAAGGRTNCNHPIDKC